MAEDSAAKVLASKGDKLHTHEMHIRHADNGGYIARHDLRDKHGRPPADGQKDSREDQHPDMASIQAAIAQHMQQDTQGQPMQPDAVGAAAGASPEAA
jgi:hypothetical protein